MRLPIPLAKMLGNVTARYRWFSVVYLLAMFLIFPFFVFSLSLLGTAIMLSVMLPIILTLVFVFIINLLQTHRRACLPLKLQNWHFLPLWLRSLDPYDRAIGRLSGSSWFACCGSECCANGTGGQHHHIHRGHDGTRLGHHEGTHQSQLHILGSMYKANSESNFYEKSSANGKQLTTDKKKTRKTVFKLNKKNLLRANFDNNNGHANRLMSVVVGNGRQNSHSFEDEDEDDWDGFNSHTVHNCFDVHRYYPASPIFMHKIEEENKKEELGDTDLWERWS